MSEALQRAFCLPEHMLRPVEEAQVRESYVQASPENSATTSYYSNWVCMISLMWQDPWRSDLAIT